MSHDPSAAVATGFFGVIFLIYAGLIVFGILSFVFWIVEIIDVARREFPDPNTKVLWLLLVILLHGIGALIYYFVGKPQGYLPSQRPLATPFQKSENSWPPPPGNGSY